MIRRLAWAALSFAAAVFAAHYLVPRDLLLPLALLCGLLTLPALALRGKHRQRAVLLCVFLALGFVRYWAQWALVIEPAERFAGQDRIVTARVTDYPVVHDGYTTVYVRLADETLPTRNAMFYSYDGDCGGLRPGDFITAEVRLRSAETRLGEKTDAYLSKGIALRGYFRSGVTVTGRWRASVLYAPKEAAHWLQNRYDEWFPPRTAMFLKALTTGEKSDVYLDPELYVSLSVAGILHVIAISGMHVALLLWAATGVFGYRRGVFAAMGMIVFFAFMTGGSPSVLRAAMMQILYLLAPALKREPDGVTALSGALFVLLFVNPCAAGSVSLQMSFAAMAGLLLLTPRVYDWFCARTRPFRGLSGRIRQKVLLSLSATIGASVCSAPLSALHFGYVSLYGALTNLAAMYTVPACFVGGFIGALLSLVSPWLGKLAGLLLSIPTELTFLAAKWVAKLPYAAVYFSHNGMGWWFAGVYGLFVLSALFRGKRPYRPLRLLCLSAVSLLLLTALTAARYREGATFTAVDVGQGQSIAVMSGDSTVVVDCGGNFNGAAGDETGAYLLGRGRGSVDLLVLTHLHADHANGVTRLMARMPVKRIILRQPADDGNALLPEILEFAEKCGTEVSVWSETGEVALDGLDLTLYLPPYKGENHSIVVRCGVGTYDALILGDVNETADKWLARECELPDGELLVAGHHGAKTSTTDAVLDAFTPETALISVGYNQYGHPAPETLRRLTDRGIEVHQTCQEGTVEVRIK